MNENLSAFGEFRSQLKEKQQQGNGDEIFNGFIEYKFKRKVISERLNVKLRLTTMEYGQISISDGDFLYADLVHMELNPNFQTYTYNNGTIEITGNSGKLGSYMVLITEE
ncbi:hypothetical protein [Flavobacterium gelatinilyticum]|uniref:hypothetical protein n=1 Tax=Flavobacterium gelatinilyticum TaxID=3003260 RepID=UPI0024805ABF|nr:hypothetical protein [Flavobacterium gelatinilyticum]